MITLNGTLFAENQEEFSKNNTCAGFYKRLKRKIELFDKSHALIGIINRFGVLACATKVKNRYWYSYATIAQIGEYKSYLKEKTEIQALTIKSEFSRSGTEREYWFK